MSLKSFSDEQKAVLRAQEITQRRFTEQRVKELFPGVGVAESVEMAAEIAAANAVL